MQRLVATLTTIPSRYDTLYITLKSLKRQTKPLDCIYLSIPKYSKKLGTPYPEIPERIKNLCKIVEIEEDYGPITKILGGLYEETENSVIFSFDDDVEYHPEIVEKLYRNYLKCRKCVCGTGALIANGFRRLSIVSSIKPFDKFRGLTGFKVPREGRNVDVIFGVAGVLYDRNMFPKKENLYEELLVHTKRREIFCNDDILISGYLSKKGIQRKVFLDIPSVKHLNGNDALCEDTFNSMRRTIIAIRQCKKLGFFPDYEYLGVHEEFVPKIATGTVVVLMLIFYFVFLCIIKYNA